MPTHKFSERHIGPCDGCPASIGFGQGYVEYDEGGRYHDECDPFRGPKMCRFTEFTGCNVVTELEPGEWRGQPTRRFYTECDECCTRLNWWLWESSIPQLARALYPFRPFPLSKPRASL